MKLSAITEGIVSTSRGHIVGVKNDIAAALVNAVREMGFKEPDVEFADSTNEDAIIYIDISGDILIIKIMADDDIQIQIPESLSNAVKIHDYQKLGSPAHVVQALQRIQRSIQNTLA